MADIKRDPPELVKPVPERGPGGPPSLEIARPAGEPELARALRMNALLEVVTGVPTRAVTVAGWTLERPIGTGGMGSVYRAHGPDGRAVALKLLHPDASSARFGREAALLRRIDHPRVVRYVDHGVADDGRPFLVMEWLDGEDLATRLRRGTLDLSDALTLAMGVALGLGALHRAGVVHRDVKPANVLLVDGRLDDARLVDLGVALADGADTRMTTTGSVLGTPHYMAPEQIHGQAGVRIDVYALGACLWECLGGSPPFTGETPGAVLTAVLTAAPPSLLERRPELPPAVDALVGRLLAKDPQRRPEDMDAVVLELAELLAGRGPTVALSRAERPRTPTPAAPTMRLTHPSAPPAAGPPADPPPPAPRAPAPRPPLVGRAPELGQLRGLMAHAVEDGPVLVAITGAAGTGRTAVLRAAATEWEGARCEARCDPADTGTPFALARRILGGHGGDVATDGADPLVVADRLRLAWLDALDAAGGQPRAWFLDDLHLADLPSLRLVALAAAHLHDAPFLLVFTAPPDGVPAFAAADPHLARVPLGPLGRRAMRQLAAAWGIGDGGKVDLAGGNPRALARLGRAEADWGRFEDLPAEQRRVARACALAGRAPDREAVAALLGVPPGDPGLDTDLAALVRAGLLDEGDPPRFPSEAGREVVLASCTDADRRRGAEGMAAWLDGRHRPAERAEHLRVVGARAEATRCLLLAARQGVAAGDEALTRRCLAEAAQEAEPDQIGEVALLRAEVAFWGGDVAAAAVEAKQALAAQPPGSAPWFEAAGIAITAMGQQGSHEEMWEVIAAVQAEPGAPAPHEPTRVHIHDARLVALCRALSQHSLAGVPPALAAAALDAEAVHVEAQAWQARARAAMASVQSFDASIAAQLEAHRAHVRAGDPRSAAQIGLYLGSWYVWSGDWERAEEVIEGALRTAQRLGAAYLELWGRYVRGKLWVEVGDPTEARAGLERVAAEAERSPRIQAGARVYASLAAFRAQDFARAATLAAAAEAHPGVLRAARAARCRAVIATAGPAAATAALAGLELTPPPTREAEWDELIFLALAEVAAARGEDPRPPVRDAADRIRERAATLADPLRRDHYLGRPHLVGRTLAWESTLFTPDRAG